MFPNAFEYVAPASLEEAVQALVRYGDDAKVLAGGQSLLPIMKLRVAAPAVLVDINRIPELAGFREDGQELWVGALTRHATLEWDQDLVPRYPLLGETAGSIADPLVRNRGTIAGSLAHADPAADWGAALLALRGAVTVRGSRGDRRIAIDDLFLDVLTTNLEPDEIITGVHVPRPTGHVAAASLKLERKVGDFAVVGVALHVETGASGAIAQAGIGLAAVGPTSLRAREAETLLVGQQLTPGLIREAADLAAKAADPASDQRGSADYKRDIVRVFVERGLGAVRDRLTGIRAESA